MGVSDADRRNLLALLDRLAELEPEELLDHFTTENIQAVRRAIEEIKGDVTIEVTISSRRFVAIVRELSEAKSIWSEKWSQTMKTVDELSGKGKEDQALTVLRGFIRFCPSPYYRALGKKILRKMEEEEEIQ